MSAEATNRLLDEWERMFNYFRKEYDMSYAEAIGCCDIMKRHLMDELMEVDEKPEEGEEWKRVGS